MFTCVRDRSRHYRHLSHQSCKACHCPPLCYQCWHNEEPQGLGSTLIKLKVVSKRMIWRWHKDTPVSIGRSSAQHTQYLPLWTGSNYITWSPWIWYNGVWLCEQHNIVIEVTIAEEGKWDYFFFFSFLEFLSIQFMSNGAMPYFRPEGGSVSTTMMNEDLFEIVHVIMYTQYRM